MAILSNGKFYGFLSSAKATREKLSNGVNITKWENHGYELSGKLLLLSRSMGHRNIQSTFGYFHLTPMLVDKLKINTSKGFSDLSPKPPYYEK